MNTKTLTIRELVEKLLLFDQDLPVTASFGSFDFDVSQVQRGGQGFRVCVTLVLESEEEEKP